MLAFCFSLCYNTHGTHVPGNPLRFSGTQTPDTGNRGCGILHRSGSLLRNEAETARDNSGGMDRGGEGMENDSFKYSYKTTLRENLGLTVYNCGYQKCTPGHSWGPAVRDHHIIHLVISGSGVFRTGGREYHLSSGDAFFCPPNQVLHYWADEADPWEYYWVGFNGTEAERMISLTCFSPEHPVEHFDNCEMMKSQLLEITRNFGSKPYQEARMVGELYLFLSGLMERADRPAAAGSSARYVEKAVQFIAGSYAHNINVEEIASHVGISRSHLYRVFVQHLGLSPNEYLIRFRINEACSLLRKRCFSIGEISYSVGFSDQLYFSRQFKKIKGVSPSKYLEKQSALPESTTPSGCGGVRQ